MNGLIIFNLLTKIVSIYTQTFLMAKVSEEFGTTGMLVYSMSQYLVTATLIVALSKRKNSKMSIIFGILIKMVVVLVSLFRVEFPVQVIAFSMGVSNALLKKEEIWKKEVVKDQGLEFYGQTMFWGNIIELIAPLIIGKLLNMKTNIPLAGGIIIVCIIQILIVWKWRRVIVIQNQVQFQVQCRKTNNNNYRLLLFMVTFGNGLHFAISNKIVQAIMFSYGLSSERLGILKSLMTLITIIVTMVFQKIPKRGIKLAIGLGLILTLISSFFLNQKVIILLVCYRVANLVAMRYVNAYIRSIRLRIASKEEVLTCELITTCSQILGYAILICASIAQIDLSIIAIPISVIAIVYAKGAFKLDT